MTNKEILKKAVQVAYPEATEIEILFDELSYHLDNFIHIYNAEIYIYSRDFHKAFWGEDRYYHINEGTIDGLTEEDEFTLEFIKNKDEEHLINNKSSYHWYQPKWQYHLQQLILYENPLRYIKQFLRKGETD